MTGLFLESPKSCWKSGTHLVLFQCELQSYRLYEAEDVQTFWSCIFKEEHNLDVSWNYPPLSPQMRVMLHVP